MSYFKQNHLECYESDHVSVLDLIKKMAVFSVNSSVNCSDSPFLSNLQNMKTPESSKNVMNVFPGHIQLFLSSKRLLGADMFGMRFS